MIAGRGIRPCDARRRTLRALIVEHGLNRAALAGARALREAGWGVGIGAPSPDGLAAWSRASDRWHPIPAPHLGVEDFIAAIDAAVDEEGYEVVFGCDDDEVLTLSLRRGQLGALVPYAEHASVARALDKLELARAARRTGLETPATVEATEVTLRGVAAPVIVKPRRSATLGRDITSVRMEAGIARSREEAARLASEIRTAGGEPLLQELVAGRLMSYAAVADRDGRIVAAAQHQADRIWPPDAGGTVRATAVPVDAELAARAAALLAELAWFGLAQLQFVVPDDGVPRLIDFNGRFYGSMALALASGSNLPAIWAALAAGRPPPRAAGRTGGAYHWLEGDLRRAAVERRGGAARDALDCLRYASGATDSIWSATDPWPGVRYVGLLAGRGLRKGVGRMPPRRAAPERHAPERLPLPERRGPRRFEKARVSRTAERRA